MGQLNVLQKVNARLLPQFSNKLATSNRSFQKTGDEDQVKTDFQIIRDLLHQLFVQTKHHSHLILLQNVSDLLQVQLEADYVWVAEFSNDGSCMKLLAGRSKTGKTFHGEVFPFGMDSPFEKICVGECCCFPRNASVVFANNPYVLKYNINALVAQALVDVDGKIRGAIAVLNETSLQYPGEYCELLEEAAASLSKLLYPCKE